MMNDIDRISRIKVKNIDEEHYFLSLISQAKKINMLSDFDLERIQIECINILAEQVKKYNGEMSSSIKIETAQGIMASILYTVGLSLKKYSSPDEAVKALKINEVSELYHKGIKRINTLLKVSKTTHFFLTKNMIDTENVFYCSTLTDGIKGFFKLYNPDFSANEIHITADYLTFNPIEKISGIEFINKYLKYLYYENEFCASFSDVNIHRLLRNYDKKYQELLFNIYEVILKNALGCVICKVNVHYLELSHDNINYLTNLFKTKNDEEIVNILKDALEEIKHIFLFSGGLDEYLKHSLERITDLVIASNKYNTSNQIFTVCDI